MGLRCHNQPVHIAHCLLHAELRVPTGTRNKDPGMGSEVLTKVMLGKLLSLSPHEA